MASTRWHRLTAAAALAALLLGGCATGDDTSPGANEQNFESRKEQALEDEAQREKAADERERRRRADERKGPPREEVVITAGEKKGTEPEPIPEDELPALQPCEKGSNAAACGLLESDGKQTRITIHVAPALMMKGSGDLDPGALKKANEKSVENLLPCYAWAHQREGATKTEYDVEYTIDEDGSVRDASAKAADYPVGAAVCLQERIEQWTMPEPLGGPVTVIGTYTFTAAN